MQNENRNFPNAVETLVRAGLGFDSETKQHGRSNLEPSRVEEKKEMREVKELMGAMVDMQKQILELLKNEQGGEPSSLRLSRPNKQNPK